MLFYYGHNSHFDDRALYILCKHNIQFFKLKAGDYVHNHINDNGPNMKLKNPYGNTRMNWMIQHGTLKVTPAQTNSVLILTWGYLKIYFVKTTQNDFRKTHTPPLSPPEIDTNHQSCLVGTQK